MHAYGLTSLKCFRGGTAVIFKNCDGQKTKESNRYLINNDDRFSFTDVEFMYTCANKPLAELKAELGKQNGELL
jgi:hypothetical protein